MNNLAIVGIGGSFGSVEAMLRMIGDLDPETPAAYFLVIHVGSQRSTLAELLQSRARIAVSTARQGDRIAQGHMYVAPPDHHLLLTPQGVRLSRGPRENWTRPAIDPLFRTAAETFGKRVIGVVLSGRDGDGTAGLYDIVRCGGKAIVQDPTEAVCPDMPWGALQHVDVDHWARLADIPPLLNTLARGIAGPASHSRTPT